MNKVKETSLVPAEGIFSKPLLNVELGVHFVQCVAVNHDNIGSLIGRLMQMCDLIGDVSQRKALKDTIKSLTRDWLDTEYEMSGSSKWGEIQPGARLITIGRNDGKIQDGSAIGVTNPWANLPVTE